MRYAGAALPVSAPLWNSAAPSTLQAETLSAVGELLSVSVVTAVRRRLRSARARADVPRDDRQKGHRLNDRRFIPSMGEDLDI